MKIDIRHHCDDFNTYRAARVKSLFNAESGANFTLQAELHIDDKDWQIGVVVGPSGSGKTSIGKKLGKFYKPRWVKDKPIVDEILPSGNFNEVTGALSAVGLGDVPAWLRPYQVLSNGEKFRADMARLVVERPQRAVIDEFTSVVDRQIAKIGSLAFAKSWRRGHEQVILLTPHYDILDWIQPDWVFDTANGSFARGELRQRPKISLDIYQTNWRYWPLFEPHHYLKLPHMIAATNYVGFVNDQPVVHVAFSTRPGLVEARACRLVVMPEWQGAGVGLRFLNNICQRWLEGDNRYNKKMTTLFHTSHPGLATALRRSKLWTQVSGSLCGSNGKQSMRSLNRSAVKNGWKRRGRAKHGGHFRAVQGFRYLGYRA